jgi:hypothetical protein
VAPEEPVEYRGDTEESLVGMAGKSSKKATHELELARCPRKVRAPYKASILARQTRGQPGHLDLCQ